MKKVFPFITLFFLLCNLGSWAKTLSKTDSVIWYLRQVKGLQRSDTLLLGKVCAVISKTAPDSLPIVKIDSELQKLFPLIHRQNCIWVKMAELEVLTSGKDNDRAIRYGKSLIDELKNYSNEIEQNELGSVLAQTRFLFKNTNRINEGVDYYQRLANTYEQAADTTITCWIYWALAGFYNALGLVDKTVYCETKSMNFIKRNKIGKGNNWLSVKFDNHGLITLINRKAIFGTIFIENEEPQRAFPFLYEAKTIFEAIKDSVEVSDGRYVYLQIARAKTRTGGDSVLYYFDLLRRNLDLKNDPIYFANYYQERGYYWYLQNRLDSAEYYLHKSRALKDSLTMMINTPYGILIPGYYQALIKIKQHKATDAIRLLKDESSELLQVNLRRIALKEWALLSDAYEMNGDFKNSNAVLRNYNLLQKQITADERRSRSMSFETEQQINFLNAEKQNQHKEIGRQKLFRNLIGGGLALMTLFSILFLFQRIRISKEKKRSDELLLNILPAEVATELKQTGRCQAKTFSMVTVMFADFKDFTSVSEKVSAELLVDEINYCFSAFDRILPKYKVEKIKTVGDAYICVSGMPVLNFTHAFDLVSAALEIRNFMLTRKQEKEARGEIPFQLRIGIHTGPVVAGIVGVKKFQYDIWGDTVNLAARMEQSGEAGQVNISGTTYALVKDKFTCKHRGKIVAKNKGEFDMYFVEK